MVTGNAPIKTPDGQAELATRARQLSQRHRTVLLLVNGRRTEEQVKRLAEQAGVDADAGSASSIDIENRTSEYLTHPAFHRHRTERARLDVEKQRADLAERMGALASVDAMRAAAGESARLVNTKLMELPERLSPLLAVETDPLRIHALLTSEIRGVLNALADRARELGA